MVVTAEAFTNRHRDRIFDFAMRNRIPTIFGIAGSAEFGGFSVVAGGL